MPERAHELGVPPELAHDLGAEELGEIVARALARDALEGRHGELATDDRGDLRQPARPVRQAVDARDEQVLERGREEDDGFNVVVHVRCRCSRPPPSRSARSSSSR